MDAIELIAENNYDIVFLDENMPGLTGIETLTEIKNSEAKSSRHHDHKK